LSVRKIFKGTLILSGGYDAARAESDLAAGNADLIAVGRPFLANPDLVARRSRRVTERDRRRWVRELRNRSVAGHRPLNS
jgi:2,4-dienoyl-CoA reductase-like NADH-dependent reductase (Old Yellow Enzyme family)